MSTKTDELMRLMDICCECYAYYLSAATSRKLAAKREMEEADATLRTAIQEMVSGWRPIETAPQQDDHSFLVLRNVGRGMTYAMQVSRFEGEMYPDHLDSNVDYGDRVTDATHWQPLPEPPEAS